MKAEYASLISILQMIGVMGIIVALFILSYKLIVYRNNADKRTMFMEGLTRLLIGVIIIGFTMTIVGFLYKYLMDINIVNGTDKLISPKLFGNIKANSEDSTFLIGAIADLIVWLIDKATSILGLVSLSDLITPGKATIFTQTQWQGIAYVYTASVGVAISLFAIMVCKTGYVFLKGAVNPKEYEIAKEDLLRWFFVVIIISCGLIFAKGIIAFANLITNVLNEPLKSVFPNFDAIYSMDTGDSLTTAVVHGFFIWIKLKVNVLFIIRDWTLGTFIIFTPIAAALWGINKSVNAFGVWFGEIITNAFFAPFMSFTFIVYVALLNTGNSSLHSLLFIAVGLSMTIKLAGVLRNSLQGYFTRMSGMNEEDTARKFSVASMFTSGAGAVRSYNNLKNGLSGAREVFNNENGNGKDSGKFAEEASKVGSKVTASDALGNEYGFNSNDLTTTDKNGETSHSVNATRSDFLDNIGDKKYRNNMLNKKAPSKSNINNVKEAENETIGKLQKSIMDQMDDGSYRNVPAEAMDSDKAKEDWAYKEAQNQFYSDVYGVDNYNPKDVVGNFTDRPVDNNSVMEDASIKGKREEFAKGNFNSISEMINKENFGHQIDRRESKQANVIAENMPTDTQQENVNIGTSTNNDNVSSSNPSDYNSSNVNINSNSNTSSNYSGASSNYGGTSSNNNNSTSSYTSANDSGGYGPGSDSNLNNNSGVNNQNNNDIDTSNTKNTSSDFNTDNNSNEFNDNNDLKDF